MILFILSYVTFNMSHSERYKFKEDIQNGKDFPAKGKPKSL